MPVDPEKLKKLQAKSANRLGGKGTQRRKQVPQSKKQQINSDSKKLQASLKKIANTSLDTIDEVNMFKDDGSVIHFQNPAVFCAPGSNTFTVAGQNVTKKISEMPQVLNQLGLEGLQAWAKSAETAKLLQDMGNNEAMAKKAAEMGLQNKLASFENPDADDVE